MADDVNTGGMPGNDGNDDGGTPLTFDGWLGEQDDSIKGLIDGHVGGLKSALDNEREQRKQLSKALKGATKQSGDNAELRTALESLSEKLEMAEQEASFYRDAATAGVTNLKLGLIAAREAGAIDGKGRVNFEALKADYPELFNKKKVQAPPGNAGAGGNGAGSGKDMNSFIRAAAGRQQ